MKIEDDIRYIMGLENGRRVIAHIISMTRLRETTYTTDAGDATVTLALRTLGDKLIEELKFVDKDLYLKMVKEELERYG